MNGTENKRKQESIQKTGGKKNELEERKNDGLRRQATDIKERDRYMK